MVLRLVRFAVACLVTVSLAACDSKVMCLRGETEDDAGICVELPKDSSVSAATEGDASGPRDGGAPPRFDASPDAEAARSEAGTEAPDSAELATDAMVAEQDAESSGPDSGADDAATSTVDAAPACVPASEVCDGHDNDCDDMVDEDVSEAPLGESCSNGGQGVCSAMGKQVCLKGAPVCNAPPPMPMPEICDGIDNDCKNGADDTFADKGKTCTVGTGDCVGTGVYECDPADPTKLRCTAVEKQKNACGTSCGPVPAEDCSTPADDNCNGTPNEGCKPPCLATSEICDGKDNNCNGVVDDVSQDWYHDCDGDGYAPSSQPSSAACDPPATAQGCVGWTLRVPLGAANIDCDDASADYNPGITRPGFARTGNGDLNCDKVITFSSDLVLYQHDIADPQSKLVQCPSSWDPTAPGTTCCWKTLLDSTGAPIGPTGRHCSFVYSDTPDIQVAVGFVPDAAGGPCSVKGRAFVWQPCL